MTPIRIFVHGVTVEAWTRRHGVEPYSHPCSKCGRLLTTSLPFVDVARWGDWSGEIVGRVYGLHAPVCICGNERTPYVVVLG